jgi:hypothetical protein
MENGRRYDIVRAENEKSIIWLEGASDFEAARSRVSQLISFWPGKYQIFDLQTKQVVLDTSSALEKMPASSSTEISELVTAKATQISEASHPPSRQFRERARALWTADSGAPRQQRLLDCADSLT